MGICETIVRMMKMMTQTIMMMMMMMTMMIMKKMLNLKDNIPNWSQPSRLSYPSPDGCL